MSVLDAELKSILQKNDVEVERFLRIYIYRAYIWRFIKWLSIVTGFLCAIYWVPILNWNASAIGRLGLIHSVHPFYNWEHLANARCLVDMGDTSAMHTFEEHHNIDPNSVPTDTCSICENLISIDRQSNLSFGDLQSHYLRRNHPVIVTDSHSDWSDIHKDIDFIEFIETLPELMTSEPCNMASNLFAKRTTLQKILRQIERLPLDEKWFFHFRNCQFESVKASRAIVPHHRRPYFLPNHLPPFRSNWLLVSHHYELTSKHADDGNRGLKLLNVRDLVIVMQLHGEIEGRLEVSAPCVSHCADLTFKLTAGQSIVFLADFWNFYYGPIADVANDDLATTFIIELEWELD